MNKYILSAILLTTTFIVTPPAIAKVGVASVVNGSPLSRPPAQNERVLHIGNDIIADEVVATKANDRAQLVFLDGSNLTIGPNSNVAIDRFVFDSEKKSGTLDINATRGVLRYVGGVISKTSEVKIKTPGATMGIRGGIATVVVDPNGRTIAMFLFGATMTVTSNGVTRTATQPGTMIVSGPGQTPSYPTPIPVELLQQIQAMIQSPSRADDSSAQLISNSVGNLSAINSTISPTQARADISATQHALQGAGPLQGGSPLQGAGPLNASNPMQAAGPLQNAGPLTAASPLQETGPISGSMSIADSGMQPGMNIPNVPVIDSTSIASVGSNITSPQPQTIPTTSTQSTSTSIASTTTSSSTTTTTNFISTPLPPPVYNNTSSSNVSPN